MTIIYNNILIKIFILISVINIGIDAQCITPDNVCVPIHNCKEINNKLYNSELTEDEKYDLGKQQCGFKNDTVYVCCKSSLPKPKICGPLAYEDRIAHGNITKRHQFPWTALLIRKVGDELISVCGGSLLNERYVLTSAHCVMTSRANPPRLRKLYEIRLGEWNKTSTTIIGRNNGVLHMGIEKYITHENYNQAERRNDIALLKLDRDVKYTKFIAPICLPDLKESYIPTKKNSLIIMGWGETEKQLPSDVKRFTHITYVPEENCENIYRENVGFAFKELNKEHFCAGGKKDSCFGDSGGPIVTFNGEKLAYVLLGVVTSGINKPCDNNFPGIYTKISNYLNWIIENMEH